MAVTEVAGCGNENEEIAKADKDLDGRKSIHCDGYEGVVDYRRVPVILVSSCQKGIEEAKYCLGEIETVAVKEGFSRMCAVSLSRGQSVKAVYGAAVNAWKRRTTRSPYQLHD